ncbi:MAG TPA: chemotaxis-specific protein-glutamate methyltransferase CheB [Pirellulales bacterium]|jgi:two-component system chemotaxis response regulator CheB|nr:chemotaxis-specific protein-glutamate methyltransferase CheB [Pirellulales bacterium]
MKKIRVMIVEDSRVVREFLEQMIEQDPRLEVAAAVASAEEALKRLNDVSPDVISMDIRLPGMNGLEATQIIMRDKPTPIVVVAASVDSEDLSISMNALGFGALAIVEKPMMTTYREYQNLANHLCTQLVLMSQVKVIRQRFAAPRRIDGNLPQGNGSPLRATGPFHLVGIVASTGGPAALRKLLGALDPRFPLPIALVQHISDGFLESFVSWLGGGCPFRVVIPRESEMPLPGTVYVAPAGRHLCIEHGVWHLDAGNPVSSQRPSGTILFRSMAQSLGARALGVLLTGMGEDGAVGLKELRDAGGYTIAEDESTAVVFGMPAAAARIGAVCELLPLPQISHRLEQLSPASLENRA